MFVRQTAAVRQGGAKTRARVFAYTALGLGVGVFLGVLLAYTGGNAQQEKALRAVALPAEATTVVESPLTGTQSAIVTCLDTSGQAPVSSSAAVVVPAPMNPSVAHEAVAVNRLDRIMFTLSVTNRTNIGVKLTLVNRLTVGLSCDVHFLG